jgi:glycosyltransferase involved in cell wall biosynthesis
VADDTGKPLVTFYVIAYNQARFVREAVEGALRQTYSPTEILLSDDCSTDDTFHIIQEVVKGYSGPHVIVLNRNERNLGLSGHLNRIMELAKGELIVPADGDDVSEPWRIERCVDAWLKHGKPAALASSFSCIDAAGKPSEIKDGDRLFASYLPAEGETRADSLVRFVREGSPRLASCSCALSRDLHAAFGPIPPDVWFEDDIITLRAWLSDRIVFIPEALVRYREHDSNIVNRVAPVLTTPHARHHAEEATRVEAQRRRQTLLSYLPDLELAVSRRWITRATYEELTSQVGSRCALHQVIEKWWSVGWLKRLGWFLFFLGSGRMREGRWCSTRLLPFAIFLSLAAIRSRMRG